MPNIDVALGLSDPAMVTRWFVNFPDLNDPYEVIAETIEIALPKIGAKSRRGQGKTFYYADAEEVDAISLGIYETSSLNSTRYFERWYNKVKDREGNYGVPLEYKRTFWAHIYHLDRDEPVATLTFRGAWPPDRSGLSYNYEDETGRIRKQVQLQVDGVEFEIK